MKVIFTARDYIYPYGGFEEHIYQLTKRLIKQQIECEVLTTTLFSKERRFHEDEIGGVKVRRFPIDNYFFGFCYSSGFKKALLESNCHLIHAQGWGYYAIETSVRVGQRKGLPVIVTPHGLFHPGKYYLLKKIYNSLICGKVLKKGHLIALTNHQAENLSRMGANSINIIPNGIDLKSFKEKPKLLFKEGLGIPRGRVILGVGRIAWYKGYQDIIKALPYVLNRIPDVYLVITGEDWGTKEKLKSLAKEYRVNDHLIFSGYISKEELTAAYHEADLFISSSAYEGFGINILEAMAVGKPVIATKTGIALDLEDTILTYDYGDYKRLGQLIHKVLEDRIFAEELSIKALKISDGFSWDEVVYKTLLLYKKLIAIKEDK